MKIIILHRSCRSDVPAGEMRKAIEVISGRIHLLDWLQQSERSRGRRLCGRHSFWRTHSVVGCVNTDRCSTLHPGLLARRLNPKGQRVSSVGATWPRHLEKSRWPGKQATVLSMTNEFPEFVLFYILRILFTPLTNAPRLSEPPVNPKTWAEESSGRGQCPGWGRGFLDLTSDSSKWDQGGTEARPQGKVLRSREVNYWPASQFICRRRI